MHDFFENTAIGVDTEKISRFENKDLDRNRIFLEKIYTENEIKYCYTKGKPSQHLAVRYCAKEAIVKALSSLSDFQILYNEIEILNNPNGSPYVNLIKYKALLASV